MKAMKNKNNNITNIIAVKVIELFIIVLSLCIDYTIGTLVVFMLLYVEITSYVLLASRKFIYSRYNLDKYCKRLNNYVSDIYLAQSICILLSFVAYTITTGRVLGILQAIYGMIGNKSTGIIVWSIIISMVVVLVAIVLLHYGTVNNRDCDMIQNAEVCIAVGTMLVTLAMYIAAIIIVACCACLVYAMGV